MWLEMIDNSKLKLLEQVVNSGLDGVIIPYKKGNSIRIGKVAIRKSQKGEYNLYDTSVNKKIGCASSINSAVAIAKNYAEKDFVPTEVFRLDKIIEKYSNDIMHYQYTLKNTKNTFTREIMEIRLECAKDEADRAKNRLDKFIFN